MCSQFFQTDILGIVFQEFRTELCKVSGTVQKYRAVGSGCEAMLRDEKPLPEGERWTLDPEILPIETADRLWTDPIHGLLDLMKTPETIKLSG